MPDLQRCENPEAHDGHTIEVHVEVACHGLTRCGRMDHTPHRFYELQEKYCPGVCLCGLRKHSHGPGDHK